MQLLMRAARRAVGWEWNGTVYLAGIKDIQQQEYSSCNTLKELGVSRQKGVSDCLHQTAFQSEV